MTPFDAVYIINLASRTDRKREMIRQMQLAGIDPDSPQIRFFEAVRPTDAGGFPTIGTRGCFLSHLGVLKDAVARAHSRILVLEDDLNFVPGFVQAYEKVVPALRDTEWGIAYLATLSVTPPLPDTAPACVLPPTTSVLGQHMFAVDSTAMQPAIDYFEAILGRAPGDPAGGPMHVDGAYSWFRRAHPAMTTLLISPALGYQRPSRTDIHALRWFDRAPVIREIAGLARRMKAGLRG